MEKIVMVLNVENTTIEVNDVKNGGKKKKIAKSNLLVTDGYDKFVAEAFDQVAEEIQADNLKGKLCGIVCQLSTRKWEKDGRKGEATQIRVISCKGLIDEMAKHEEKESE